MHFEPQYYSYRRQRRKKEYLMPFIGIIAVGIVLVFGVQLLLSFRSDNEVNLNTKVNVYSDSGNLQILPASQNEWIKGYNGSVLVEGDTLRVGAGTKAVLVFNDENVIRVNENSQLVIDQLTHDDKNGIYTEIKLSYGDVWVNKKSLDGDYIFLTENGRIYSIGTIFAIENKVFETLRVLEGNVQFDILENNDSAETADPVIVQEYVVRVGQQMSLNEENLNQIKDRKSIDLVTAISNDWEDSGWYKWNIEQDKDPTDFELKVNENGAAGADLETVNTDDDTVNNITGTEDVDANEPVETETDVKESPILTVSKPASSPYTLTAESFVISGQIKGYANSVTVEMLTGTGLKDVYELQKFEAGNGTWSYTTAKNFNNLTEGENKYTIYAKGANGQVSPKVYVTLTVPVGTFKEEEEEEKAETEEVVETPENTDTQVESSVVTEEEVQPTEPAQDTVVDSTSSLFVSVGSFNGSANTNNRYETTEERVEIIGSASLNVTRMYVNGFQLTQYASGSGSWKYYAKTAFNNLNPGENYFSVYGVDSAGNKTSTVSFVIVKK